MKTSILAFAATAALFSFAAPVAAANVIVNGDFESGVLSPWFSANNFGGTPWVVTGLDAQTGTYSAGNSGNNEIRQNFAGVAGSSITAASLWMRHPDLSNAPSFISFFYDDMTSSGFVVSTNSTEWQKFDILSQLNTSKTLTGFALYGYSGGGADRTFIDNVVISTATGVVPEPASWAMLIAGFGLTGAAMRRRRSVAVAA